ncbi:helix-turn-helix domain protein, putative transcriptional regulator [Campylobacter pinnipediorum subsp. caledonicus]|uniref:Helix-turn-helix domain protein, putative transcriptional regulator n=1 Tax=Campylobacter pinnipediorum subsp. caledonicus TaxID=1874362 RepID=A0A1S6U6P8_9BACT|nr:helix-turn-helix domain-containing protein [Campylobacter pinnipediorum]AQW87127.1 helix-turn-helix domain protein, putative transcriptional regulator [Campylobacter pinnipediorum subsp. caledonicus]
MNDELLTAKEVMQLLKISATTLWKYVKAGKINKHSLTKRTIRYSKNEILQLVKSQTVA